MFAHPYQGYVSGAFANVWLTDKIGFGKVSPPTGIWGVFYS